MDNELQPPSHTHKDSLLSNREQPSQPLDQELKEMDNEPQSPQPPQPPPHEDSPPSNVEQPSQSLDLDEIYRQELKKMEMERYEIRKKLAQPESSPQIKDPVNLDEALRLYISRGLKENTFPDSVILSEDYQKHFVEVGKSAIRDFANQMRIMINDLKDFQMGILFTCEEKRTFVVYPYEDRSTRMRTPIDPNYVVGQIKEAFGHIDDVTLIRDSYDIPPLKYEDIHFYNPNGINHFYRPYIRYLPGQHSAPIIKSTDLRSHR